MRTLTSTSPPQLPATYLQSALYFSGICFIWMLVAALSVAAGARWFGAGRDFLEYMQFYQTVTPYSMFNYSRFEIGFEFTAFFFGTVLNLSYESFVVFLVAVALSIKFYLFRRYLKSPWIAILAYVLLFYPLHEYTQIRAAVAIAFGYLGVHFIIDRRYLFAFLFLGLGLSFHSSILILGTGSLALIILPRRFYIHLTVIVGLSLAVFYGTIVDIMKTYFTDFNPLISAYLDNSDFSMEANIFSGTNILLMLATLTCFLSGYLKRSDYHRMFFFLCIISFVWLALFQSAPVVALRTAYILFVAVIFLVYKMKFSYQTAIPQVLVILAGSWAFYRAIDEGVIAI